MSPHLHWLKTKSREGTECGDHLEDLTLFRNDKGRIDWTLVAWPPLIKWLLYEGNGKTRNLQQQVLASLLGHRCQTPLDGSGARRITLLILPTLLAPQSCERKSGNGKFSGSERFISSVRGGIRKRGLAEVGWDKVGVVRANRRQ